MRRAAIIVATLTLAAARLVHADIGAPLIGYVLEPKLQQIRPIQGIPGAATLGTPLDLGFPVAAFSYCPASDLALLVRADDGSAALAIGFRTAVTVAAIDGAIGFSTLASLNPTCSAGILYSKQTGQVQFVSLSNTGAMASAPIAVSGLGDSLTALAITPSGSQALAASTLSAQGALYLLDSSGTDPVLVGQLGNATAIAFDAAGGNAFVADNGNNQILVVASNGGAMSMTVAASADSGLNGPSGLVALPNNVLVVANAGLSNALEFSTDTWSVLRSMDCPVTATEVTPLMDSTVLALNKPGDDPLLLLNQSLNQPPRIVFVPVN